MALAELDMQNNVINKYIENDGTIKNVAEMKKSLFNLKMGKITEVLTLNQLISELHVVFESDHVNIEYVNALMTAYKSNHAEWKKFAKFDRYRYTRNLVDRGNDKFNLMILCWGEGQGSAIHDHANAHCFMKVLQGELMEVRFEWPKEVDEGENKGMQEQSRTTLEKDSVCYINDDQGLHRVENPSHSDVAVSLHLYCPPFSSCSVFNQQTGQKSKAQVTFWSYFGNKRNKSEEEGRAPEDN